MFQEILASIICMFLVTKFQGFVLSGQFSNISLYYRKEDITQVEVFPIFFFFYHSL